MRLIELNIRQFRNLESASLKFHSHMNVICGPNGAGKTNLLEAIYILATGRSFRTRSDREIIKWEGAQKAEFSLSAGRFEKADGVASEGRVVISGAQKRIFLNEKKIPTMASYWGELNAVVFTPDDLQIVKGDPGNRRSFLDSEFSQMNPSHLVDLQQYAQAIKQRNALLRGASRLSDISTQLDVWDQKISEISARIFYERRLRLEHLEKHTHSIYSSLTKGTEEIKIRYMNFLLPLAEQLEESDENEQSISDLAASLLASNRENDFERRFTTVGPHRDDFLITIDGLNARHYASQGQQRSFVLALRLAELELFREIKGEYPIVMLDDISSELDDQRRARLAAALPEDAQIFVTTVTPETLNLPPETDKSTFWLKNGKIR